MKIIIAIFAFLLVILIWAGIKSQQMQPERIGLSGGMLMMCPDSPNCVCSEKHTQDDKKHYVAPIHADKKTWLKLAQKVAKLTGVRNEGDENYLHAEFHTSLFHFADDLELRYDEDAQLIHIRSASRMGHSDFGANRKRVEMIRKMAKRMQS